MNEIKKETVPLLLTEYRSLINRALAFMTNQAYANGNKFSYHYEFKKGKGIITLDGVKHIKDYYTLTLYMNDKSTSKVYSERINLIQQHYPATGESVHKIEMNGLYELILNGLISVTNTTYYLHLDQKKKPKVTLEDVTEGDIKKDDIILNANIKKDIAVKKLIV